SLRPGSGSRPAAQVTRPGTRSASTPTTRAESASSTIVASSRPGRRAQTGCGPAPSVQQAPAASRNPTGVGGASGTRAPPPAPAGRAERPRQPVSAPLELVPGHRGTRDRYGGKIWIFAGQAAERLADRLRGVTHVAHSPSIPACTSP